MNVKEIKFMDKKQTEKSLNNYEGKLYLIINTASKCGFTPQFDGLEKLHQEFKDQGLVTLGFPCNQFLNQEPNSAEEASEYCRLNYGVSFEIMDKVKVKGKEQHPLFAELVAQQGKVKWNFTKFLVAENGQVIKRFGARVKPEEMYEIIADLLK